MSTPNLYDPDVPELKSNSLAVTQPQIQNNFLTFYNAFLKNHVTLSNTSTGGNHTIIELLQQSNDLQTDLNELNIYSKAITDNTNQMFVRYEQNGTVFNYTCYQLYAINDYNYFTCLPGNIIIYFGTFNTVAANTLINNKLKLLPPVVKTFLSVSTTPVFISTPANKPVFSFVIPPPNTPYSEVIFNSSSQTPSGAPNNAPPPCHYIIIASVYTEPS